MKKLLIFVFAIIIIIFLVFVVLALNKSPKKMTESEKQAAIAKILGRKPILADNAKTGDVVYKGKYVSFIYPAAATIYTQMLNGTPVVQTGLEYFSFDLADPKLTFSMEVVPVPQSVASLSDYPSVKLREIESSLYVKSQVQIGDKSGLVFRKSGNIYEKTVFVDLGRKVFSFTISGSDGKGGEGLYMKIVSSLKFL